MILALHYGGTHAKVDSRALAFGLKMAIAAASLRSLPL